MVRSQRPSLFKNSQAPRTKMKQLADRIAQETVNAGANAVDSDGNLEVVRKPKYLEVTEKRLAKLGVIDLKPYFAKSNKRTRKKDGGWYIRIPIKRKARSMSRRMYDQLRQTSIAPDERRTVISDYLYDRRRVSEASMLNYTPKSKNIEKRVIGTRRHAYTAFRTVSDKSKFNSWVLNRKVVNKDDTSKTFVSNVNRLMKWKMRNGWK